MLLLSCTVNEINAALPTASAKPDFPRTEKSLLLSSQALGFLAQSISSPLPFLPIVLGAPDSHCCAELHSLCYGPPVLPESLRCTQGNKRVFYLKLPSPLNSAALGYNAVFPLRHNQGGADLKALITVIPFFYLCAFCHLCAFSGGWIRGGKGAALCKPPVLS